MGKYNKFNIDEINPGDLIYFDDEPLQSNYDEHWEVQDKNELTGEVWIKLHYLFEDHFWKIHVGDIRQKLTLNRVKTA